MNYILLGVINIDSLKNIKNLKNKILSIGILSCTTNDNYLHYYSICEIKCFDFYCEKFNKTKFYINGKKMI